MLLMPQYMVPDVFALTDEFIAAKKIRAIIFDIDNTLVGYRTPHPTAEIEALFERLRGQGIKLAIVSNNKRSRVQLFAAGLGVPAYHRSAKPLGFILNRVRRSFGLPAESVALVGDQIYTDVLGGNCAGMITVLVEPVDHMESLFFKVKRALEMPVIKRKRRKDGLE